MREPKEFEVRGVRYRSVPLSAMQQVHLSVRLAPVLTALRGAAAKASNEGPMAMLDAAIVSLNDLPPERLEAIVAQCMNTVQRQKPGDTGWAKAWNQTTNEPMFSDISGTELLAITAQVAMAEVGPFWEGLASSLTGLVQA